jgi:hypothetical protein
MCPGLVDTDLGRSIAKSSIVLRIITPIYMYILGKTPDHGARHCVSAAIKPKEEHVSRLITMKLYEFCLSTNLDSRVNLP